MILPVPMTAEEIGKVFNDCGLSWPQLFDNRYSLPALDWLERDLAIEFRDWLRVNDLLIYEPEENDCDKFSRYAITEAIKLHHATENHVHGTSLAFGLCVYARDSGGAHAIDCAVVRDPDARVVFWEPQNVVSNRNPVVTLSANEIASARCEI